MVRHEEILIALLTILTLLLVVMVTMGVAYALWQGLRKRRATLHAKDTLPHDRAFDKQGSGSQAQLLTKNMQQV